MAKTNMIAAANAELGTEPAARISDEADEQSEDREVGSKCCTDDFGAMVDEGCCFDRHVEVLQISQLLLKDHYPLLL